MQPSWFTFPYHGYSNGHSHELALGPHMCVHTHPPLLAFSIEAGHRGVVGHLLCHKAHLVGVLGGGRVGASLRGLLGGLWSLGYLPGAVEGLADDGVVGLLGDGALAALVEGGEVVLHKPDHAVLRAAAVGDGHKQVWV